MKRCISFLLLVVFLFAACSAEQASWDCPECGRKSNLGNFCGNCAHPAPWTYAPPKYQDQSQYFEYKISGLQAYITKYTGTGGTVFIPPYLGGKPVELLGRQLFANNGSYRVKCVVIPAPVTYIGRGTFYGTMLSEVYIPFSVKTIEPEAFAFCKNLNSIHMDPDNKQFVVVDNVIFSKNMKKLVLYPGGKKDDIYTIPEGTTAIEAGSFTGSDIKKVVVSDGVSSIGETAFWGCKNLTSIEIPASVRSIADNAFGDNPSLKTILGEKGSAAEQYAADHKMKFILAE